jgi:hypothetical protein
MKNQNRRLWNLISPILPWSKSDAVSSLLLRSALSGLLGVSAIGCGEDGTMMEPDPVINDAALMCTCPPVAQDSSVVPDASVPVVMTLADAAPIPVPTGPVVTKETEGNRTFAEISTACDALKGYTQVHAACSGVNACAGFSYGDWDPGVTAEHTCAGVNGCNGISCVVLPKDEGRTGKAIYEAKLPETGPRACTNCHGGYDSVTKTTDTTKFKVYFMPGETTAPNGRTLANWKDKRTALEQARMVAFGSTGRLPDGSAFAHMAAYHKLFSRAEIERTVEHIRTLQAVEATVKIKD